MNENNFKELENTGFSLLGERDGIELLLGLAGRFCSLNGVLQKIDSENFFSFNKPGYAKAAWNFLLIETTENVNVRIRE